MWWGTFVVGKGRCLNQRVKARWTWGHLKACQDGQMAAIQEQHPSPIPASSLWSSLQFLRFPEEEECVRGFKSRLFLQPKQCGTIKSFAGKNNFKGILHPYELVDWDSCLQLLKIFLSCLDKIGLFELVSIASNWRQIEQICIRPTLRADWYWSIHCDLASTNATVKVRIYKLLQQLGIDMS